MMYPIGGSQDEWMKLLRVLDESVSQDLKHAILRQVRVYRRAVVKEAAASPHAMDLWQRR